MQPEAAEGRRALSDSLGSSRRGGWPSAQGALQSELPLPIKFSGRDGQMLRLRDSQQAVTDAAKAAE
eukprot:scaffold38267_cov15-Tisochrysis_lutea.AAC.1